MNARRCVLCETAAGGLFVLGWTQRTLTAPVVCRSTLGRGESEIPAGQYDVCPVCSAWLTDHRDRALPAPVLDWVTAMVAGGDLHPTTARHVRMEIVGMVRHLAEALTGTEQ